MNDFDEKELEKLTKLARIQCTKEEKGELFRNLTSILSYIEEFRELDLHDTPPCDSVLETVKNVMRDDIPERTLSREEFLNNSPAQVSGMIRVPPVLLNDQ